MTPTATLPEAVTATVAGSEVGKKNLITGDGFFLTSNAQIAAGDWQRPDGSIPPAGRPYPVNGTPLETRKDSPDSPKPSKDDRKH